ncbi:MAG TPA: hypothetical protein PLS20_05325 [Ruminococcus flavefaciens]|nr:hypothetical protein [Ruminococcus flavefaciens]
MILIYLLLSAAVLLITALVCRRKKLGTLKFAGAVFAAAVILELTVFQFPSYRLAFGSYPRQTLYPRDAAETVSEEFTVSGGKEASLTYRNINIPVGTVRANIRFDSGELKTVVMNADMTDDTGYYYRMSIVSTEIVRDCPRSADSMVLLSGNAGSARFRFQGGTEEDSFTVESIELNTPIPFDILPLRTLAITLIAAFVYAAFRSFTASRKAEEVPKLCRWSAVAVTAAAVCCMALITAAKMPEGGLAGRFSLENGDQITEELVTAFENGHVWLDAEPEPELLAMEDPYDWGKRHYDEIPYRWDHLLYNGRYYSYYGVAPLILFLPYHLITGHFFPTDIAVLLFSSLGMAALAFLYCSTVRKRYGMISFVAYISGLVILLMTCGAWFCVSRPMFYETAVSSAFFCLTAAACCFTASCRAEKKSVKYLLSFLSSLMLGLSVLSRPTMAVYAIAGVMFYARSLTSDNKAKKNSKLITAACLFMPLVILGVFQMWYNYVRFGSVFDFGIKYSLTINDFTHSQFHIHFVLIGLYNFLFAPPAFIPDYPYITTPFSQLGVNGYYYKDDGNTSGILFLALPVFGYLFGGRLLRYRRKSKAFAEYALLFVFCVAAPFVIIFSSWESGYALRYTTDFSWEITIGGILILFEAFGRKGSELQRVRLGRFMMLSGLWAVLISGMQIYNYAFGKVDYPQFTELLRRHMELWH